MIRPLALFLAAVLAASTPSPAAASPGDVPTDHSYVYLGKGGSVSIVGDGKGIEKGVARARRFRQGDASVLWFQEGGQEYIVRDPDTLAQLEAAGVRGRGPTVEEHRLDRQHERLTDKRQQLEDKRDELAARRDALTERETELAEREARDAVKAAEEGIADQRREVQREQQALAAEARAIEPTLNELRPQIDAVERQIDALRRKRELASNAEICALFRRAIAAGTATPVR